MSSNSGQLCRDPQSSEEQLAAAEQIIAKQAELLEVKDRTIVDLHQKIEKQDLRIEEISFCPKTDFRRDIFWDEVLAALVIKVLDLPEVIEYFSGTSNRLPTDLDQLNFAVVFSDVNYLKFANDHFQSHDDGDMVLMALARSLRTLLKCHKMAGFENGEAFRLGEGDELGVILVSCPKDAELRAAGLAMNHLDGDQVSRLPLPTSAAFGTCHFLEAAKLFRMFYQARPDLFPKNKRDLITRVKQFMTWIAESRTYKNKILDRMALLAELQSTETPKDFRYYFSHLVRSSKITLPEIRSLQDLSDDELIKKIEETILGHQKLIIDGLYTAYARTGMLRFEQGLCRAFIKEVVAGVPVQIPEQGELPQPRYVVTL